MHKLLSRLKRYISVCVNACSRLFLLKCVPKRPTFCCYVFHCNLSIPLIQLFKRRMDGEFTMVQKHKSTDNKTLSMHQDSFRRNRPMYFSLKPVQNISLYGVGVGNPSFVPFSLLPQWVPFRPGEDAAGPAAETAINCFISSHLISFHQNSSVRCDWPQSRRTG